MLLRYSDFATMIVDFNSAALPFRAELRLASARCLFSTNSRQVLNTVLAWQPAEKSSETNTFHMQIIESESRIPDAPDSHHFRGIRHLVFARFSPPNFVTFDLLRRRVMGVFSPAAARDPNFWSSQFLPITIGLLGTTLGVAPLHCACLDRKGSALLVTGNSGAGKSTLTAALAKQGFGVVSDECTYVSLDGNELVAHGLFAPLKLLPDAVRFFPELRNLEPKKTLNGEIAHEIDPATAFQSEMKAHSRPRWMLFLRRTAERGCHFVRCEPEYVARFFEESAEKLPPELANALCARSKIIANLARCNSWILHTGDSPMQTAAAIDQFLLEV
jgi:hypothetical protein